MLAAVNRLKSRRDFDRVYKQRLRRYFPECVIYWRHRDGALPSRLGVVVSNKITKKAVLKNRAKRLVREAIRTLLKEQKIPNGIDVVVVGKKEILQTDYHKLYKLFESFSRGIKKKQ